MHKQIKVFLLILINLITFLRFPLSFIFVYLVLNNVKNLVLLSFIFSIIVITDILDGFLARSLNLTSNFGAILDVSADFLFIVSSYVALYYIYLMKLWFILFIIFKFLEFILTSNIINLISLRNHIFLFDKSGRIASGISYILPIIIILSYNFLYFYKIVIFIFIILIFLLYLFSTLKRLCFLIEYLKSLLL